MLSVCIPREYANLEETSTLFIELARDLGLALYKIALKEERKQAEEKLFETKEYLENLIKYANAPIIVWDTSLSITRFNQAFENLSGYDASEVIGKKIDILFSKNKIESALEHIQKTSSGERWEAVEIEIQRKDGESRIVLWNSANILDKEMNNVIATIAQGQNITERKQTEETLRKSERNLAAIMNASTESIFLMDLEGGLLAANESLAQRLGTDLETLLRGNFYEFLPPDVAKNRKSHVKQVIKSGKPLYFEDEHFGRTILNSLYPIFDSKEQIIRLAVVGMDITERKQAELIHSERMAIAVQLAAGVAHEFNNLLSIIGGSAEYAKGIRNESEINKSLDVIVKSANRGAQVVKKLLTFTKRIELKKESVDLIDVIEEVVGLAKRDLENNSITVVRNYSDIPKTLIDVGQIQQVFLNLIINAKNAMSKGGKLTINVEKEGEFIKIQFHNTGKVINKEDLPRLFTPFFMTSRQQKKGMPGTGLGLAVSYGIIKAHNGVIKAESAKGKGTTFTVLLSVTKNENMAEVLPKAVAKAVKNNKRKLKQAEILIVDDEVEIGKLFKKVLDKEGYSVTFADSGGNALNLCRKKKFDLIYLDIIMPGMDGIFVFKKIKEISPKTKIVFFTGKLIEDKVAEMCLNEGAAGFLRKPIPLKDLVSYTQNILKTKNE
jgi:PAS domain S-box-containing protein